MHPGIGSISRRCITMKLKKSRALAAAALSAALGPAYASDAEGESHGYFRGGGGGNSSEGSQACYSLEGAGVYRLGNECTVYGELQYRKELVKTSNGASFVGIGRLAFQEGV